MKKLMLWLIIGTRGGVNRAKIIKKLNEMPYNAHQLAAVIIELANIILLSGLLYLYTKSYRQIKIGFTVGLILFAIMLLIKSISAIVFLVVDSDLLIGRPVYIGGIIEFIALAILLKITWDY